MLFVHISFSLNNRHNVGKLEAVNIEGRPPEVYYSHYKCYFVDLSIVT